MSTVDPVGIDATKPSSTAPTTQSVRDNFAEIKTQFSNAAADISATEAILNGTSAMQANLDLGSNRIIALLDPTAGQDAATKSYVDSVVNGLDWQESVLTQQNTEAAHSAGARYLIGPSPTGAWVGHANEIAESDGATWSYFVPSEGTGVNVEGVNLDGDSDMGMIYNGTTWNNWGSAVHHNTVQGLQGGTTDQYYHLTSAQHSSVVSHLTDTTNPHGVTKAQVGLGNVANVDTTNAANLSSGTLVDARVAQSNVTQHQAALAIAASQLTGTLPDARVAQSNVTQHQAALTVLASQLTGTLADARVAESNVTQHQAALSLTKSQVGLSNVENIAQAAKYLSFTTTTSTAYTLVLGDDNGVVEMSNSAASTCTVPPNSSVAFPIGTEITVTQQNLGQVTIVAGSGVTLRTNETLLLRKQYSAVTLIKRGTDEWYVLGDVELA